METRNTDDFKSYQTLIFCDELNLDHTTNLIGMNFYIAKGN